MQVEGANQASIARSNINLGRYIFIIDYQSFIDFPLIMGLFCTLCFFM